MGSVNLGLQVSQLSVKVGGKQLMSDVNFQLECGSVMAVIGPNGAGKSTLLQAFGGEYRAESGSILWSGREISSWSLRERARWLAMMPQLSSLPFPFSAEEVVGLGRLPHSAGHARDRDVLRQVMELLDVFPLRHRLYTQLSGGEKQRVQLARSIAQVWDENGSRPRLLLLDEPSSALDMGHQQQLVAALTTLKKQNITVVMAVHDLNLAAACADGILALQQGRQLAVGRPDEVLSAHLLSQLFGAPLQVINNDQLGRPVVVGV